MSNVNELTPPVLPLGEVKQHSLKLQTTEEPKNKLVVKALIYNENLDFKFSDFKDYQSVTSKCLFLFSQIFSRLCFSDTCILFSHHYQHLIISGVVSMPSDIPVLIANRRLLVR